MLKRHGVIVASTPHAVERALERVPRVKGWSRDHVGDWIERTVCRAIRDGRRGRTCPSWCRQEFEYGRRKKAGRYDGGMRYCWDEDDSVVFVVKPDRRETDGARVWIAVTVLVAHPSRL